MLTVLTHYRNEQYDHSTGVFVSAHVALRTLLALSQPVNCIFWPIETMNWLVAAIGEHVDLLSGPTVYFLYCGIDA